MYRSNFELLLLIVTLLTICIQLFVLYLVQYRTTGTMRDYKFFLVVLTLWDIAFSALLGLFLQPYPLSESLSARIRGFSAYLGPYAPLWTTCAVVYAGIQVIVSQNHCLLYRYFVLHNNCSIHTKFMSTKFKWAYIVQAQVVALVLSAIFYKTLVGPGDISRRLSIDAPSMLDAFYSGERFLLIDAHSTLASYFFLFILLLFLTSEVCSFVLICAVLAKLKRKSGKFSKLTYKLHFQFTLLLAAQLLTPLIFIFGPVSAYILTALCGKVSTQLALEVGLMFLALYGTANSLLTICFVGPYRSHVFKLLVLSWLRPLLRLLRIQSKWITEMRHSSVVPGGSVLFSMQHIHEQLSEMERLRRASVFVVTDKEEGC